ncbi:highly divergent homeobox isoform X1 [Gadus macrocephalus]|uniref:highly divergent homeobox isoform X1 n=1 Tax=Gadus macrocephalus TaxID=80720 RepID=UPI0028CB3609|nr:highly divergent homeobox isoform X1 [Gadus macrocephalus]XP_059919534.1 highly divergent homeobox isoform X1 [Gadus macrocephalus]
MAAPFPTSGTMDSWTDRHGLPMMNLRSVFTTEQQRVLERYYDNGMTNQSKACFQLILQCAQETKLDFSVVRTWVGNKRRKLASKTDQNGGMPHTSSNHGPLGGLLSNHALVGGSLSNHSLAGGPLITGTMLPAARSIQSRGHLLPPSSSFPPSSLSSSSHSSSSPLGSGNNNNNNDVILTGIYSLNPAPCPRPRPLPPPTQMDTTVALQNKPPLPLTQSVHIRARASTSPLPLRLVTPPSKPPSLTSPPGPSTYASASKAGLSLSASAVGSGSVSGSQPVPHSWARQYGSVQSRPWSSSLQSQPGSQSRTNSNPLTQPPARPRARVTAPTPPTPTSPSDHTLRIQQVFTLSGRANSEALRASQTAPAKTASRENRKAVSRSPDAAGYFSIAMETGNEEDEWQQEAEFANMSAQSHTRMEQTSTSLSHVEVMGYKQGNPSPPSNYGPPPHPSNAASQGSYSTTPQTSLSRHGSSPNSFSGSAVWLHLSNSRKRTLQDRTQFSDGDLVQLRRYWNRGMTSLGFVCREKITAAANQLNVDTEIVKTWISNRRRKCRLMGIEIPPPTDGPAVFTSSPGDQSLSLTPEEEALRTPELGDELNDEGSLCLSEDGLADSFQREGEDGGGISNPCPLANDVKIEIIDEDEEDVIEMMPSDMEQMQNLLEFKHEEVQFLESELENQKQKYQELEEFTKSLVNAIKNNDLKTQQDLLASLPQPDDGDAKEVTDGRDDEEYTGTPGAMSPSHDDQSPSVIPLSQGSSPGPVTSPIAASPPQDFPPVTMNHDGLSTEFTEPSASEEPLGESVTES